METYRADINAGDNQSWSPLHTAAKNSRLEVFQYLVDKGASLYATTANGSTPLHYLVRFAGSPPRSPRQSARGGEKENIETKLLEVVQKVIDMGADINSANRSGDTPLHLAAYVCSSLDFRLTRSFVCLFVFFFFSQRPYFQLIKLLLENKANISSRNLYICYLSPQLGSL